MIFANQRGSEKHKYVLIANQFISQITTANKAQVYEIGAITELVNALYEYNLWEKFIAIYPFIGNSSQKALNLIDPFKYKITWNGSIIFNNNGITGNGGIGLTGIPLNFFRFFENIHLSAYVRTPISNTSGNGRLIGANTTNKLLSIKDVGAIELNFNKQNGIIGFVYNIINDKGGFGMNYQDMLTNNIDGRGFLVANSLSETKNAKCYLNGQIFGAQYPLLPTEIHPANPRQLTIFGDGYDNALNSNPLRANLSFLSVGYGLTENDIYNFTNIVEIFQASTNRSIM
jgi:hypothetical protein